MYFSQMKTFGLYMSSTLLKYCESLQAEGIYTFTLEQANSDLEQSELTIKKSLLRLVHKGKIVSVRKGFYVIVPLEYSIKGILPPLLFINNLMDYIGKPYYVALSSAAMIHGAAHQKPQDFYVITTKPALRPIDKKGIHIDFITKSSFPKTGVDKQKTDTGMINLSVPELTAFDLIRFENKIGGLNRVVTILDELCEKIDSEKLALISYDIPATFVQRLGYILEYILQNKHLTDLLYQSLIERRLYRVPLGTSQKAAGYSSLNRWNVIENTTLESDL